MQRLIYKIADEGNKKMIAYNHKRLAKSNLSSDIREQILNNNLDIYPYNSIRFYDGKKALRNVLEFEFDTDELIDSNTLNSIDKFLYENISKFTDYLIIGTVCEEEEGGSAVILQNNGEIYELDHDVTDVVLPHFLNSSFRQMEKCVLLYEEYFCKMDNIKKIKGKYIKDKEKDLTAEQIELLFTQLSMELSEIDENIFNPAKKKIISRYNCKLAWETILYFGKRTIYRRHGLKFSE